MAGDIMEGENRNPKRVCVRESLVPTVFQINQDPDVVEKILQFIYSDEKCAQFNNYEEAKATILAAREYLLLTYEKICGTYLASKLTTGRFVELYNLAVLLKNEILLNEVQTFSVKLLRIHITGLTLEAFNDYFKHISTDHPNEAIKQLHAYFTSYEGQHKKKKPNFPMENIQDNIDWTEVQQEEFQIINSNEYLTSKSLINVLICQKENLKSQNDKLNKTLKSFRCIFY